VGTLSVHGQTHAVAQALIATYLHLPLYILCYFPSQVSLHLEVLIYVAAQPHNFLFGQAAHLGVWIDLTVPQDIPGCGTTHPENIGEGYFHPLVSGKINARYSRQDKIPPVNLTLPLLMAGVLTDDQNLSMAADYLAFIAHLLYRRPYLHFQ
jgi:hypothetical protein